jgi:2-amino-4-hydroxy-6-hydroxymethyldihydropteridine diphosphokinase
LGSNIGDRLRALQQAADRIGSLAETEPLRASAVYETEPWGYKPQPAYLNCVLECETAMELLPFHAELRKIEETMGRLDAPRYHPRIIDIDILFYGDHIHTGGSLSVPHPSLQDRRFVLIPLLELAPDFVHPLLRRNVVQLYASCTDEAGVRKTGDRLRLPVAP